MEKNVRSQYRRTFDRMERLILFCKVELGWGRPRIVKNMHISSRQVEKCLKKIKEWRM